MSKLIEDLNPDAQLHYLVLDIFSMFACWFQPGLISQTTMFSSHNKPAPAGLISPETNQRTGSLKRSLETGRKHL